MKKSKLLFLTPCVAIATMAPIITSCNPQGLTVERIIDDIFNPCDQQTPPTGANNIIDALATVSSKQEMQDELIYDLFLTTYSFSADGYKLKELYDENKVGIQANINRCSMYIKNENGINNLYASFLGYVSFVFIQKVSDKYQVNDYVMYTFDILDLKIKLSGDSSWGLEFSPNTNSNTFSEPCIGFIKVKSNGGTQEHMNSIQSYDTVGAFDHNLLPNWHGWYVE